jgi:hypothetical protein
MESIAKQSGSGDYQGAIGNIEKNKKKLYNSEDEFLLEFDLGILYHYNREYRESTKHLARAEQILEDLYSRSITNEAAALLTNDNIRPYRSYPFEEQWLYKIQILNYLALNEKDGAAVEARRALLALQRLREREGKDFNESGALQTLIALAFERQNSQDDARIAYENAKKVFKNSGYTPRLLENPYAGQEIILVGYAGLSPYLGENKFWGTYAKDGALVLHYKDANGRSQTTALFALGLGGAGFTGQTVTIQFAIPKMVERPSQTSNFVVSVGGKRVVSEAFSNTGVSMKKDFESGQNAMLLRTAGRVILRTIAASKAKSRMQTGDGFLDLALNIGADIATGALEEADLRLGSAMPLTLQVARIPVEPGRHVVKIDVLDYQGERIGSFAEQIVDIKKGEKAFIFAPSLR